MTDTIKVNPDCYEMPNYRENITWKEDGTGIIQVRHIPSGMWLNDTVQVSKVWEDSEGWHATLRHVEGVDIGTLSSKDGTALLTIK